MSVTDKLWKEVLEERANKLYVIALEGLIQEVKDVRRRVVKLEKGGD